MMTSTLRLRPAIGDTEGKVLFGSTLEDDGADLQTATTFRAATLGRDLRGAVSLSLSSGDMDGVRLEAQLSLTSCL